MTIVREVFCNGCLRETTHERAEPFRLKCRECGRIRKGTVGIA